MEHEYQKAAVRFLEAIDVPDGQDPPKEAAEFANRVATGQVAVARGMVEWFYEAAGT